MAVSKSSVAPRGVSLTFPTSWALSSASSVWTQNKAPGQCWRSCTPPCGRWHHSRPSDTYEIWRETGVLSCFIWQASFNKGTLFCRKPLNLLPQTLLSSAGMHLKTIRNYSSSHKNERHPETYKWWLYNCFPSASTEDQVLSGNIFKWSQMHWKFLSHTINVNTPFPGAPTWDVFHESVCANLYRHRESVNPTSHSESRLTAGRKL